MKTGLNTTLLARAVFLAAIIFSSWAAGAVAEIAARPGWTILPSAHTYEALIERVNTAAKNNKVGVVTRASATVGAKKALNKKIPGNMVVGLYHPRFAVRMLEASVAAGIEAPIRVYITENPDGTATLSYKKPSAVFAPYMDEGGSALGDLAAELDGLFDRLAREAVAD